MRDEAEVLDVFMLSPFSQGQTPAQTVLHRATRQRTSSKQGAR
jgi:hypothetical protein